MAGPLEALDKRYHRMIEWVSELPHLGIPSSAVGHADMSMLPPPDLSEISHRSKDPHVLGARVSTGDVVLLLAPMPYWRGQVLTHALVWAGVHPEDILIASANFYKSSEYPAWTIRNSVEWLFWTAADQRTLGVES